MLSKLNKLILQKELIFFGQIMCFWTKKSKNTTTTKQKIKQKNLVGAGY